MLHLECGGWMEGWPDECLMSGNVGKKRDRERERE